MKDGLGLRELLYEDVSVYPCLDFSKYESPVTVTFADTFADVVEQQVKDDMVSVCKKFGVSIDESKVFDLLQGGERAYNEGYRAGLNDLMNMLRCEEEHLVGTEYDFKLFILEHVISECKELLDRRGV